MRRVNVLGLGFDIQQTFDKVIAGIKSVEFRVKISPDDSTPAYVEDKIEGGGGLEATTVDPGANEKLRLDVVAGDGSITVAANSITVGEISDVQHGNRAGGTLHAPATDITSGFLSASDKSKIDSLVLPVDTLATLGSLPASGLPDGTEAFVNQVEDIYVLEKASAHSIDGVTVIAAAGGGYWVARHQGRWDDLQGDISQGVGAGALTYDPWYGAQPAGYPPHLQYYFRNNQDDDLSFRFQFSHQWKRESSCFPHLHCTPASDPAVPEVININGIWFWTVNGEAVHGMNLWGTFSIQHTVNPGDVFIPIIIGFGELPAPATAKESSILKIAVRRTVAAPDTYKTNKTWATAQANLALDSADVHYRKDKIGTETQIPV